MRSINTNFSFLALSVLGLVSLSSVAQAHEGVSGQDSQITQSVQSYVHSADNQVRVTITETVYKQASKPAEVHSTPQTAQTAEVSAASKPQKISKTVNVSTTKKRLPPKSNLFSE